MTKRRTLRERAWKVALSLERLGYANIAVACHAAYLAGYRAAKRERKS